MQKIILYAVCVQKDGEISNVLTDWPAQGVKI